MPKGLPRRTKSCEYYNGNGCLSTHLKAPNRSQTPEDEGGENEGDPEGRYANEEHLTRVLALRDPVETRWNSFYYMIKRCGDIL